MTVFQSTLPRGERRVTQSCERIRTMFQSTLPRGERPMTHDKLELPQQVSIHAPARGATSRARRSRLALHCFNPRSRAGSDLISATALE